MSDNNEKDKLLDHEYDGIRELDNHMPRWWVLGFYFTIAFAFVYLLYYHIAGGPTSHQEWEMEFAGVPKKVEVSVDTSTMQLMTDPADLDAGKALFTSQTCVACHGPQLAGLVGPNLTDDFWIKGCDIAAIAKNIQTGFPEKGMPPYGNNVPMDAVKLQQVASYILSQRGTNPPGAKAIDPARELECK